MTASQAVEDVKKSGCFALIAIIFILVMLTLIFNGAFDPFLYD